MEPLTSRLRSRISKLTRGQGSKLDSLAKTFSRRWGEHFVRNHILAMLALVGYTCLQWYLWTSFGLRGKNTVVGLPFALYFIFSPMIPLRYCEKYPDQLLKAERLFLPLFGVSPAFDVATISYSAQTSLWFYSQAILGPVWFTSFLTYMLIFRNYLPRALARIHVSERVLTESRKVTLDVEDLVKKGLRLQTGGLGLYNRHLVSSYGFEVRDVDRFCKPLLVQSLSQKWPATTPTVKLNDLTMSMKEGPLAFLKIAKTMVGEPVDKPEDFYGDIEIRPGYVRALTKYLPDVATVIATIVSVVAAIYQLVYR